MHSFEYLIIYLLLFYLCTFMFILTRSMIFCFLNLRASVEINKSISCLSWKRYVKVLLLWSLPSHLIWQNRFSLTVKSKNTFAQAKI